MIGLRINYHKVILKLTYQYFRYIDIDDSLDVVIIFNPYVWQVWQWNAILFVSLKSDLLFNTYAKVKIKAQGNYYHKEAMDLFQINGWQTAYYG